MKRQKRIVTLPAKPVPIEQMRDYVKQPITPEEWKDAMAARDRQELETAARNGYQPAIEELAKQ